MHARTFYVHIKHDKERWKLYGLEFSLILYISIDEIQRNI